jgi:hypothetical protein
LQTCEWQSALAPHDVPLPQFGAQVGAWQTLFVQMFEPQSPLLLHAVPSPHVGAQAGR